VSEPAGRRRAAPLSVCVAVALLMVALAARMTQTRVPFPALDALSPFEATVSRVQDELHVGRPSYYQLDVRFEGIGATFRLNAGDRLDDDSALYRDLRATLRPGARVTAWARRMPPGPWDDLGDKVRYTDHRLPGGPGVAGLGTWSAAQDGGLYEIVQLDAGGRRVLDYAVTARAVRIEDYYMLGVWLLTAGLVALSWRSYRAWRRERR
jgi:hypothetical protein